MTYEDRTPPQDTDAERAVLGAMLMSRDAIGDVVGILNGADYYRPAHEEIHNTIADLFSAGEPVDQITVSAAMTTKGTIGRVGGALYLHALVSDTPLVQSAAYWAQIVQDKAVLRRVAIAGQQTVQWAYAEDAEPDAVHDRAEAALEAAAARDRAADYTLLSPVMDETLDHMEMLANRDTDTAHGVPTGFIDLDALTQGLQPGQVIIVAGRPAMGKSTLGVDFMRSASIHHGIPSVIFSLEMNRQEISMRILAAEAKVPLANIRSGAMSEFDWGRVAGAMPRIAGAPLFLDDSANLTMLQIRAKARKLHHEHGLGLVVIDYLQLMSSGQRVESRQLEVSEFSRQIKLLAKELNVPVVALSQLNRGVEQRQSKRPALSDLRESGAIEQDADIVVLVHRDDMYEQESSRPGECDLIVAKHRNGATRDIVVAAQLHYSRFVDLAPG